MSTMSLLAVDHSDQLAKRYAIQTSMYIAHPSDARSDAAKIPLENLFRLLQMYRYDAFLDEPSSGVLEFRPLSDPRDVPSFDHEWHGQIAAAIGQAMQEVFRDLSVEQAVAELQATLSWLATDKNQPAFESRTRAREFFEKLAGSLG